MSYYEMRRTHMKPGYEEPYLEQDDYNTLNKAIRSAKIYAQSILERKPNRKYRLYENKQLRIIGQFNPDNLDEIELYIQPKQAFKIADLNLSYKGEEYEA